MVEEDIYSETVSKRRATNWKHDRIRWQDDSVPFSWKYEMESEFSRRYWYRLQQERWYYYYFLTKLARDVKCIVFVNLYKKRN